MAGLTDAQRADIYFFCGWPQRWIQTITQLEQAIDAIVQKPEMLALITNGITDTPPGLLALLRSQMAQIISAQRRLKALKVGSIELSGGGEIRMLQKVGEMLVGQLCSTLDVTMKNNVFRPGKGSGWVFGSMPSSSPDSANMGSNWVGR